jgi:hypothetical protein
LDYAKEAFRLSLPLLDMISSTMAK